MCNSVAQNSHKTTCFVVVAVRFIGPMCVRAECVPFGNTKPNILHCTYLHSRPLAKRNTFEKSDEERKKINTNDEEFSIPNYYIQMVVFVCVYDFYAKNSKEQQIINTDRCLQMHLNIFLHFAILK